MVFDSVLDVYGIAVGFYVYDILFEIFATLGLLAFPIIVMVITEIKSCITSTMHDLNTRSSLKSVGVGVISMILALQFAVYPIMPLKIDSVKYYSRQCAEGDASGGTIKKNIGGDSVEKLSQNMIAQFEGKEVMVPALYYISLSMGYGIKNWAVSELPCSLDLRLMSEAIDNESIKEPLLREETQDFVNTCFSPGAAKYTQRSREGLKSANDWPGSSVLLKQSGYYDNADGDGFYSKKALPGFKNSTNKIEQTEQIESDFGFPTCKEWWNGVSTDTPYSAKEALSTRLFDSLSTYLKDNHEKAYRKSMEWISRTAGKSSVYTHQKDSVVRDALFSQHKLADLSSSLSVTDYGLQGDTNLADYAFRGLGTIGLLENSISTFSGASMLMLGMPMAKPFVLMTIFIALCPALVVGSYKWKYIGMFCFVTMSVLFMPFFWELARLIDDTFLDTAGIPFYEINTKIFSQWIISAMYVYLPASFTMFMGWVGMQGADSVMDNFGKKAGSAGNSGASHADKAIGAGKNKAKDLATGGINAGVDKVNSMRKGPTHGKFYY
ncbi:conjugal transfer protein TraG N-terminal domain-containing protein [Vibrio europaeus]|uniref:conjugal transfer protein TraG N-terminal domain-containing protein n=1 Tax=Vibrio europaeus TaxID=300876 RepID=UPI00233F5942|nr:conjugal transfer protein TraG N-terminal domain-containing protein [Vibrio europaeus]MDC5870260.1 conjugal transfer protein TraG N-terminal domain-containing protein [Vibrio europaeus]